MGFHEKVSSSQGRPERIYRGPEFLHGLFRRFDRVRENRVRVFLGATESPARKAHISARSITDVQISTTNDGPVVLFPKESLGSTDILHPLIGAYNQSVAELREGENRGFGMSGLTLGNRTQVAHDETRRPEEIPTEERQRRRAEMASIKSKFDEFASTHPVIDDQGNRITYQQVSMGDYSVLSDEGEMSHRPVVVVPSIDGTGPTASYSLDVFIRDPDVMEPPNMFDTDRLVFIMSLDFFPHPLLVPTIENVRGFGRLLDQVVERDKGTTIQGEIENEE